VSETEAHVCCGRIPELNHIRLSMTVLSLTSVDSPRCPSALDLTGSSQSPSDILRFAEYLRTAQHIWTKEQSPSSRNPRSFLCPKRTFFNFSNQEHSHMCKCSKYSWKEGCAIYRSRGQQVDCRPSGYLAYICRSSFGCGSFLKFERMRNPRTEWRRRWQRNCTRVDVRSCARVDVPTKTSNFQATLLPVLRRMPPQRKKVQNKGNKAKHKASNQFEPVP
jgi:hypothetical protein